VPTDILAMRTVNRELCALMMDGDAWLNKLTVLVMQYPALVRSYGPGHRGAGIRVVLALLACYRAIGSGELLAQRHFRGEFPFLLLHGTIHGARFTPFSELRFPVDYGVISELIDLLLRGGAATNPAYDATLMFDGAPPGVAIDGSFRKIHKQVRACQAEYSPAPP
jgi:hypothetical protein